MVIIVKCGFTEDKPMQFLLALNYLCYHVCQSVPWFSWRLRTAEYEEKANMQHSEASNTVCTCIRTIAWAKSQGGSALHYLSGTANGMPDS